MSSCQKSIKTFRMRLSTAMFAMTMSGWFHIREQVGRVFNRFVILTHIRMTSFNVCMLLFSSKRAFNISVTWEIHFFSYGKQNEKKFHKPFVCFFFSSFNWNALRGERLSLLYCRFTSFRCIQSKSLHFIHEDVCIVVVYCCCCCCCFVFLIALNSNRFNLGTRNGLASWQ